MTRGTEEKTHRTYAILTIDEVAEEDIGVYTCVATNHTDSVSTSCYLTLANGMLKAIISVLA